MKFEVCIIGAVASTIWGGEGGLAIACFLLGIGFWALEKDK